MQTHSLPRSVNRSWMPALVLVFSLAGSIAFATDKTYDAGVEFGGTDPGPNPPAWGALENWSPNGVPLAEDTVTFSNQFFQMLPNVHLGGVNRVAESLNLSFRPTQGSGAWAQTAGVGRA